MKECLADTFKDSRWWRCQPCHSSCLTCHDQTVTDPVYGKCPVISCPEGQYVDGEKEHLSFNVRRIKKDKFTLCCKLAVCLRFLFAIVGLLLSSAGHLVVKHFKN